MDLAMLDTLKEKLVTAKDFGEVFEYFLDHFGESREFMALGKPARNAMVEAAMIQVMGTVLKSKVRLNSIRMIYLAEAEFFHGSFLGAKAMGTFIYFKGIHMGLVAMHSPEFEGKTMFARFTAMPGVKPPHPTLS